MTDDKSTEAAATFDPRADPLGGAIFGAVSMVYWRRGEPSRTCGAFAEVLTLHVLDAFLKVARASDLAVLESDATDAVLVAISDHVAARDLPADDATALQAALARVIGRTILASSVNPAPTGNPEDAPDTLH